MTEHEIGAFLSHAEDNESDDGDASFVHQEDECLSSEQSISSETKAFSSLTITNGTEFFEIDRMIKWTTMSLHV